MILRQLTKRGIRPSKEMLKLLQEKPAISFTIPTIEAIDMIGSKKFPDVKVEGSYIYKIQRFPGDIDLADFVIKEKKGKNDPIGQLVKSLQDIIVRIREETLGKTEFFLGDVKIGIVIEALPLKRAIGNIKRGKIVGYNYSKAKKELEKLKRKNMITDEAYKEFKDLIKKNPSFLDFELLTELINKKIALRWSSGEIKRGVKKFGTDDRITLREAIQTPGIIKFDMWYWLNNRFVEVTNFFQLIVKKKGKLIFINLERKGEDYITNMKEELHKYLLTSFHFNPFKALKRMLILTFIMKDDRTSILLSKLMSSGYAMMYQVVGDLKVLLEMTETIRAPPYEKIGIEMNDMKDRLSRIYEFKIPDKVYKDIDNLYIDLSVGSTPQIEKVFKDLIMKLSNILNKSIMIWIYKNRILPLKSIYKN